MHYDDGDIANAFDLWPILEKPCRRARLLLRAAP